MDAEGCDDSKEDCAQWMELNRCELYRPRTVLYRGTVLRCAPCFMCVVLNNLSPAFVEELFRLSVAVVLSITLESFTTALAEDRSKIGTKRKSWFHDSGPLFN